MNKLNPIILVVDDDPNDLMFIQAAFVFVGVRTKILTANSGDEAIAYLRGDGDFSNRTLHPLPDFILTDLKMPSGDGFSLLEFLKDNPETATISATVLSGSQDNDDIERAHWLGASAYHVKPGSTLELRRLVKTLHDYWCLCERFEKIADGRHLRSEGWRKLGERPAPENVAAMSAHHG